MKYYIVALFDKDSYDVLNPLQRKFSKKFRANRRSPIPHIALDVIETSNIEKVTPVMEKILKPYKRFKVEFKDSVSVSEPLKAVNLKIENRGYIKKIYRTLTDNFELNGVNVKFHPSDEIGISLASLNHINKELKDQKIENDIACDSDSTNVINTLKIDRLEVWKLSPNKKEVCLKSYELKSY